MDITDKMLLRAGKLLARDDAPIGLLIHTRYQVERRLARGGMGEVFLAQDTRLNRPVAMKILASSLSDPEWEVRFEDEARTMGNIDHPGIVPIHDLGLLPDGRLYYTMKLIDGNTLDGLLEADEDRDRLLRLLARTCEVVHHAHVKGVVHRDLKPSNIMVDDTDQVYVLDWGIARVMDEYRAAGGDGGTVLSGLTSAGTILGTVQYMPPEQAKGKLDSIDERSDVYSLGAVLYEILTGGPPISGGTVTEVLDRIGRGDFEPPRGHDPSIPADLEMICLKALARNSRARYRNAREFGRDLRRWLDGDPVSAHPPSLSYRLRKRVKKHTWLAGATAAALLSLFSFGAYWITHREDSAVADAKRVEDEIFGPIAKRIESLPDTREGRSRALRLIDEGLRRFDRSWDAWIRKGVLHERLGEHDAALSAFQRALELNPRLGQAAYLRGKIFMDIKEDRARALEEFEKALLIEPANEYAMIGRARVAAAQGDFTRAAELCREAEPVSRHLEDFFFTRGYVRTGVGAWEFRNLPGAIEDFNQALRMVPEKAVTYVNLGVAHLQQENRPRALECFEKAIDIDPNLSGAYANRGIIRFDRGDLDGAYADYTKAIELKPDNSNAYTKRGNVRERRGDPDGAIADHTKAIEINPRNGAAYGNRGNARKARGDLDGAIADYRKASELEPGDPRFHVSLGNGYLYKRDLERALACYTRAIEIDPKYGFTYLNRGIVRSQKGDLDGALSDLTRAVERLPKFARAWSARAMVRRAKGDTRGALDDLTKAVELEPRLSEAWYNRGLIRSRQGDREGAIADYTKALETNPKDGAAWNNRGLLRHRTGDTDGALADYDKAIEVEPSDPSARFNRANLLSDRGDLDGAVTGYTRVIELKPDHVGAYVNRGGARERKGDIDGALADATRAIELDPRRVEAWTNRGSARQAKGDLKGAFADHTRAIEIDPRDPTAYVNRASVRKAMNDGPGRIADLKKALEVAPADWPYRKRVKDLLPSPK